MQGCDSLGNQSKIALPTQSRHALKATEFFREKVTHSTFLEDFVDEYLTDYSMQ